MGLETRRARNSPGSHILDQTQWCASNGVQSSRPTSPTTFVAWRPITTQMVLDHLRAIEAGSGGRVVEMITALASSRLFVARQRGGSLGLVRVVQTRGP